MNTPQVSVIINFLDEEQFIREAVQSVFAQTYPDWELLLVDDGSADGSTDIARQYAAQHPGKVRYLEHEGHQNRGASAARNLGIGNARGRYIAFLDADDVWLSEKLEQQVAVLDSQPEAALVYGATQWWYSWTGKPEDMQRDRVCSLRVQPHTLFKPPTLLSLFLRGETAVPCTCSILVRREVIESVGGFEEAFRDLYDDQVFYAKVSLASSFFVSGGCWDRYRQHPDSCCAVAKRTGQERSARLAFLTWLEEYLRQQECKDAEVWRALCEELWPYRHPILSSLSGYAHRPVSGLKGFVKHVTRRMLPVPTRRWLAAQWGGEK
jgi:glycosyltransferase involved in cell wall biosynthesis